MVLSPQFGHCFLQLTSLHSDQNYTPTGRPSKGLHIPVVENSVHKKFNDTIGTGVKNLVWCCYEATFQSSHLRCSVSSILPGKERREKSGGDREGIKPALNPLKAFIVDTEFCFVSTKPGEAPSASLESPFATGYFPKAFLN